MKNEKLIGTTETVLIDSHTTDGHSIGRTFRDSPEVDNRVIVTGEHQLGEFVDVTFTQATDYELQGEVE